MYIELDNCTAAYIYHMSLARLDKISREIYSKEHFTDHLGRAIPRYELEVMALKGEKKKLERLLELLTLSYVDSIPFRP